MTKKRWFAVAGTMLAIGGGLLGLTTISFIQSGPAWITLLLELLAAILLAFGITLFAIPYVPQPPVTDYDHRRAKRNDLKDIFELCERLFDGEVSSLNFMKKWYRHNDEIFWVVERTKVKRGFRKATLVGYFSIIPLTESAKRAVLANELPGTNFTLDHIARSAREASAFYIGGVGASAWRAKGHTLSYLKARTIVLEEQFKIPLLTRPITRDGLRLAEKYNFEAVGTDGDDALKHVHIRIEGP